MNEFLFPELDTQEVINFRQGSVRNALEALPPFKKYIFIEEDIEKFSEIEKLRNEFILKEGFTEGSIKCERTDANVYLTEICKKKWDSHRALVFLDPFGLHVEWKTIELIAKTAAIDLWLLFPIGTVNRLLKKDGGIHQSIQDKLNLYFGEDSWFEIFYNLSAKHSFFGEEEKWEKIGNIFSEIEEYFIKRLQDILLMLQQIHYLCTIRKMFHYIIVLCSWK